MDKILAVIGRTILVTAVVLIFAGFMGFPVKWMINWLFAPSLLIAIFGVPHISFWQAFWLSWLCSILFKTSVSK